MCSWFKNYRINLAEEQIAVLSAEIEGMQQVLDRTESTPSFFINRMVEKKGRKALLEFRIKKLTAEEVGL